MSAMGMMRGCGETVVLKEGPVGEKRTFEALVGGGGRGSWRD